MADGKKKAAKSQSKKKVRIDSKPQQFPSIWAHPVILIALMIFAAALYFMTFGYGFILDDQVFYSKNDYVKEGIAGIGKIFSEEAMAGYFGEQKNLITGARYRPLSMVTFALEHQLFGLNPGLSHVINALLYGLTGVLLFYVAALFWPGDNKKIWYLKIGFWAALLFIAHPIHTEVVANIKGRDEIMALLFALLTLIKAFKARKLIDYLWVGILFYLALLSKENSITFLAVIPAAIYVFRQNIISRKEWLRLTVALGVATVAYLLQRYAVIGYFLSSGVEITELLNNPFVDMNGSEKYATIFFTLAKYLQLLVWPNPLSHDYYPYAIATRDWTDIISIISLVVHIGLAVFALIKLRGRNVLAYFVFVYLATLSIVSNIPFTVGTTMNERFLYMSSVAFTLLVPYLILQRLSAKSGLWSKVGMGMLILVVAIFTILTTLRIPDWSSPIALNRSAVEAYPNSARSNLFMGTALFNQSQEENEYNSRMTLLLESREFINKSLEIHPIYGNGLKMKAGVAAQIYHLDKNIGPLFDVFKEVILVRPGTRYVHEYLDYLTNLGNVNPQLIDFYFDVGYQVLGQRRGEHQWAAKFLDYAYQIDPTNSRVLNALAVTYDNLGQPNRANQYRAQMR